MGQNEFTFGQANLAHVTLVLVGFGDKPEVHICSELTVDVALIAKRIQQVRLIPQPCVNTGLNLPRVGHSHLVARRG